MDEWGSHLPCLWAKRHAVHVSTDKEIYRPGESVHVRAVLVDAVDGTPLSTLGGGLTTNARMLVLSPKGDVIFNLGLSVSAFANVHSVTQGVYEVPEEQVGGEYVVKVVVEGQPSGERKFQIRTFRNPKLHVKIDYVGSGYGPGDRVLANITVIRSEGGEKLAGGKVEVTARLDGVVVFGPENADLDDAGECQVLFRLPNEIAAGMGSLTAVARDEGIVESGVKTLPIVLRSLDVRFYPEGGPLVVGVENRIYFEAVTPTEEPVELQGEVWADAPGQDPFLVTYVSAEHEGRGRFMLTPEADVRYELRVVKPAGVAQPVPLPDLESLGPDDIPLVTIMASEDTYDPERIQQWDSAKTPKGLRFQLASAEATEVRVGIFKKEEELSWTVVRLPGGGHPCPVSLPLKPERVASRCGVLRATVFSDDGLPLAERIVFLRPPETLQVDVRCTTEEDAKPGADQVVEVCVRDRIGSPVKGAIVCVTATDSSVVGLVEERRKAPRLPAMVYLEHEVEHLEDSDAYMENTDKGALAVDLLLGTQGWRRFAYSAPLEKLQRDGEDDKQVETFERLMGVQGFSKVDVSGPSQDFRPQQGGGSGQPRNGSRGTRNVRYSPLITDEGRMLSISAMPSYNSQSVDELREADYSQGFPGSRSQPLFGPSLFGPPPVNPFSDPSTIWTTRFGAPMASTDPSREPPTTRLFGSGLFGSAPVNAFGQTPTTSQFGAPSSSAVFSRAPTAASLFGSSSSSVFGSSTFGSAPVPAFGASSTVPAFGASSTVPAFGASSTVPAFSASSTVPAFGASSTASSFGAPSAVALSPGAPPAAPLFGSSSSSVSGPSVFGSAPVNAFGACSTVTPFGEPTAVTISPGAPPVTPSFGSSSSSVSGPSVFGSAPVNAFGASSAGSLFGVPSATAISSGGTPSTSFPGGGFGASTFGSAPASGATTGAAISPRAPTPFPSSGGGFGLSAFGSAPVNDLKPPTATSQFGATSGSAISPTAPTAFPLSGLGNTTNRPRGASIWGANSATAFGSAPTPAFGSCREPSDATLGAPTPAVGQSSFTFRQSVPASGSVASILNVHSSHPFGEAAPSLSEAFAAGVSYFRHVSTGASSASASSPSSTPAVGASLAPTFASSSASSAFGSTAVAALNPASDTSLRATDPSNERPSAPATGTTWTETGSNATRWEHTRVHPTRPSRIAAQDSARTDFKDTVCWLPNLVTSADGIARAEFKLSDSVTSFAVSADAHVARPRQRCGAFGVSDPFLLTSRMPLYVDAKAPLELTTGDRLLLPIIVVNNTGEPVRAAIRVVLGSPLAATEDGAILLKVPHRKQVRHFLPVTVQSTEAEERTTKITKEGELTLPSALITVTLTGNPGERQRSRDLPKLTDEVQRAVSIAPRGYPLELSYGGMLRPDSESSVGEVEQPCFDFRIPSSIMEGSLEVSAVLYTTPVGNLAKALESLLVEPHGCFEQMAATVYPNIMARMYFELPLSIANSATMGRSYELLATGLMRLKGYEVYGSGGFRLFGWGPAHAALTAYGLLLFTDMDKVFPVPQDLLRRTKEWLLALRDDVNGTFGGDNQHTLFSEFGSAPAIITNAYILWSLTHAGITEGLERQMETLEEQANVKTDPYFRGLLAGALFNVGRTAQAIELARSLLQSQGSNGAVTGAQASITRSGGESLTVETTSIAILAWLNNLTLFSRAIALAIQWLHTRCKNGRFGSTQATVLALKAIVEHERLLASPLASFDVHLVLDGSREQSLSFDPKENLDGTLLFDASALLKKLHVDTDHRLELKMERGRAKPFSFQVRYRADVQPSSEECPVKLNVSLSNTTLEESDTAEVAVTINNTSGEPLPMMIAIVGFPGGLEPRHEQLKELVLQHAIAFYEVRGREVMLYWHSMSAKAISLRLEATAAVPGVFSGPASRAYLYYTDELKSWVDPLQVTINEKDREAHHAQ